MKSLICLLFCLFLSIESAFAIEGDDSPHDEEPSSLSMLEFRLYQLSVFQGAENSFSAGVTWNPRYRFSRAFSLLANVGGAPLLGSDSKLFISLDYTALASLTFEKWEFELGGGGQTWFRTP